MNRPLVVVTRPRAEAESLAERVEARGYAVLVEPILEIARLDTALPPLEPYAALAFTSANGVQAFADLSATRAMPSYAVGPRTEEALRIAGFADIRTGPGVAAGLAAAIAADLPSGARLLHLSGWAVAQDLAALLAPANIVVDRIALYEARPASRLSEPLVTALYACTVSAVLLFSARTALQFGTLASARGLAEQCRSAAALCLSEAVAAEAGRLTWGRIAVAEKPTEAALLELLPPR